MKVYTKIAAIIADLSKVGIGKDSRNTQQGYQFRGIDAVYGALSPLLAKHGLCVLPRVVERSVSEQTSKSGGVLFYTVLKVEFDFVAAEDGSKHTVVTIGEAMDSGDKSSNKAMSAAYKYACLQAFCIPTEGDNDADAHTHEVTDKTAFTKAVNQYSERIKQAVDSSKDNLLREVMEEVKDAGNDFRIAVWATLPTSIQNYIRDKAPKAA